MLIKSLRLEKFVLKYENSDALFQNVDINFPIGQTYVVRGDRGVGRSALLQVMAGLQMPHHGTFYINDLDVANMSFEDFLPYRLKIGYGFDMGGLLNNRTLFDNMALPLLYHKLATPEEASKKILGLFDHFQLAKYKDLRPSHVSGSVRRLACLLRALILEPEILLLDDPTVGLSKEVSLIFLKILNQYQEHHGLHTLFMSTYDDNFVALFKHTNIYIESTQIFIEKTEVQNQVVGQ